MENFDLLNNDIQITAPSHAYLLETAKWGKFLAIIGFIFCGLLTIGAFFIPAIMMNMPPYNAIPNSGLVATGITVVYILIALLYIFPCIYLYKFSTKMKDSLNAASEELFEVSLRNMKSLFKFFGVFTIIILSFYALILVFALLGGLMS